MRTIVLILATAFAVVSVKAAPAAAQEPGEQIVLVGQLLSMTLTRSDFSEPIEPDAQGRIVVSNSCGTLDTTLRVIRSTADLPRRVDVSLTLGEWCDLPIVFEEPFWLLILDAQSKEYLNGYPLFDDGSRVFAYEELNPDRLAEFTPAVQHMLTAVALEESVSYPFIIPGTPATFVQSRHDLQVGADGRVKVVRGVPIDAIFRDFTEGDLYADEPR